MHTLIEELDNPTRRGEHIVHIDGAPEPSARSAGCSEAEAY